MSRALLDMITLFITFSAATVRADLAATPYQLLEKLYTTAPSPATLTDFDKLGDPTSLQCTSAESDGSAPFTQTSIPRLYTLKTATHGPLFPSSDKQVLLFVDDQALPLDETLQSLATLEVLSRSATDLIVSIPTPPAGYGVDTFPLFAKIRKNGAYIVIQLTVSSETLYTYCWKQ